MFQGTRNGMLAKAGLWLLSALKGAQPGASMLPACLWLASSREERTKGGPFRGCVVCFDLRRKMYCLYLKNLCRNGCFTSQCQFPFCFGYKLQLAVNPGRVVGVCGEGGSLGMMLDLETPNLLFCSWDCESAQRLQFFSSSEESR